MEIKLPNDKVFIENIILQRTNRFVELGGGTELVYWMKTGKKDGLYNFLNKNNLIKKYLEETLKDMQSEVIQLNDKIDKLLPNHSI